MRGRPAYRTWAIVLVIMAGAVASPAQFNQAKTPTPSNDGMSSQLVKTGLYLISGEGGNSLLRLSGNGLILVDGKSPAAYNALRARIKKISDQPVKALILTNCDEPLSGTNPEFLQDDTPLVVQENAGRNFAPCHATGDRNATPVVTFKDDYAIRLGGIDVRLMHFGNAYTSGDTVVYFPNLKVVAVGALFSSSPMPDFSAGGSLLGWGPALEQVLKLDFDTAVASSGPPITRAELQAFKSKIDELASRSKKLVAQGVPKGQFMSQLKADDLGWNLSYTPDQVDHLYAELSQADVSTRAARLNSQEAQP